MKNAKEVKLHLAQDRNIKNPVYGLTMKKLYFYFETTNCVVPK